MRNILFYSSVVYIADLLKALEVIVFTIILVLSLSFGFYFLLFYLGFNMIEDIESLITGTFLIKYIAGGTAI